MAERRAIRATDDRGIYGFALGADPEPFRDVRAGARRIEVIEALMGWEPWRWVVRVDGGTYFVTGTGEPKERTTI